ncbi:hypothetical protein TUM19329_33120 [Legionella antarctica]|uniref:Uncharacterized protein n=1 Tax=Legionella antarctica TaxID=2708020 RepID=A0A6F8T927_9GAMM|nr:hypothetical protein [Legionella antarctica]BCA96951.1 hypothetical protein TUM19329_33120 [Legionella antarctica]
MQSAVSKIVNDSKKDELKFANQYGYTGVKEALYTSDHPEVVFWTGFFQNRFKERKIFEQFEEQTSGNDIHKAVAIATQWYRFSSIMPWILCKAATVVSNNIKRHYVIQGAYEELGMRDVNEIHPERFREAAIDAGVDESLFEKHQGFSRVNDSLDKLVKSLTTSKTDAEVMGILLGLECPAEENVETLFLGLALTPEIKAQLLKSIFFRIHRAIECEHIRLAVSNFLRFNSDEVSKKDFIKGFDQGIQFWVEFWSGLAQLTLKLRASSN